MPNLIQSLGREYFDQFFRGSVISLEGKVLQIQGVGGRDHVVCTDMQTHEPVNIAAKLFTGFKTFEYPVLGYRRLGQHHIAYTSKVQSVHRGLRLENVQMNWTASTRLLIDMGILSGNRVSVEEKAVAIFRPQFDSLADAPALLEGRKTGLVLSPNLLIEPSTEADNEWFSVLFKQAVVGKVDEAGVVTIRAPEHQKLLPARLV